MKAKKTPFPIEIVLSMTGNYFPYSLPLMLSIIEKTKQLVRFHLLYAYNIDKNTYKDIEIIKQEVSKYSNIEVNFYNVEHLMDRFYGLPLGKWGSWKKTYYSHYIHLTAPLVLPSNIHKYIYLDVDMLCNTDISQLWNIPFNGRALIVARPSGIEKDEKDFNSGMCFINLDKWRNENLLENIINHGIETTKLDHFGSDQRILNLFFTYKYTNLLKYVDTRWNNYNDLSNISKAFICHFIWGLEPKPWFDKKLPEIMHQLWWYYAKKTPFYQKFKKDLKKYSKTNFPINLAILLGKLFIFNYEHRKKFINWAAKKKYNIVYGEDIIKNKLVHDDIISKEQFILDINKLCKDKQYNYVLHRHLGDIFYCLATKEKFETQYNTPIHYIIKPEYAFLMKMFDFDNYSTYPLDKVEGLKYVTDFAKEYKNIFSFTPELGVPCIAESIYNLIYYNQNLKKSPSFRWAENMAIEDNFRFKLPTGKIELSEEVKNKLNLIAPLEKIVLFAPEAKTATEFPPEFWEIIAKIVTEKGYKIIVNSSKYKIHNSISTQELNMSLSDIVALGMNCAYIFALRSGLCDVLVGAKEKLYAFYSSDICFDFGSLRHCFAQQTNVNEIKVRSWYIDPFMWEDVVLSEHLQKYITQQHMQYCTFIKKIPYTYDSLSKRYKYICGWFDKCSGKGRTDLKNPMLPYAYQSKNLFVHENREIMLNEKLKIIKSYLGKTFIKEITEFGRINYYLFGFPIKTDSFYKKQLKNLMSKIASKYDDIYILRHNIGETHIELRHLLNRIKRNGSKNPLIILNNPRHISMYRMFLPEHIDIKYINLDQSFVHEFFNGTPVKAGKQRIFCIAPFIVNTMRELAKKDKDINFYKYLVSSMQLPLTSKMTSPTIHQSAISFVQNTIKHINLKNKFVILITDASSLNTLPMRFWEKISNTLQNLGYDIFINEKDKYLNGAKHADFNLEECYYLATLSCGIVSMANGLSLFLTSTQKTMNLLYTSHARWFNYNAEEVRKYYSAHYIPDVNKNLVYEYDMDLENEDTIIKKVISSFSH